MLTIYARGIYSNIHASSLDYLSRPLPKKKKKNPLTIATKTFSITKKIDWELERFCLIFPTFYLKYKFVGRLASEMSHWEWCQLLLTIRTPHHITPILPDSLVCMWNFKSFKHAMAPFLFHRTTTFLCRRTGFKTPLLWLGLIDCIGLWMPAMMRLTGQCQKHIITRPGHAFNFNLNAFANYVWNDFSFGYGYARELRKLYLNLT